MIKETTNKIMKMIKRIFAISVAADMIPVKPKIPATIATMKKITAHPSIGPSQFYKVIKTSLTDLK